MRVLCDVIGCEVERRAKAIVDYLEGEPGVRAKSKARNEYADWCYRCQRTRKWVRLEDGSTREIMEQRHDAA